MSPLSLLGLLPRETMVMCDLAVTCARFNSSHKQFREGLVTVLGAARCEMDLTEWAKRGHQCTRASQALSGFAGREAGG